MSISTHMRSRPRERAADADRRLGLHVEVEVERDADVRADRPPERAEERLDVTDHLGRHGLVGGARPAAESREVDARRVARVDDVGLERPVAAADDLLAEPVDVVHRAERRHADDGGVHRARGPAVGPVDPLAEPEGPAEELVHRHAEGLGLHVPQRELDPRDRLGGDAAGALPRHAVEVPVDPLDRAGVLADQDGLEVPHRAHDAVRIAPVGALAVAGEAGVGPDGDELPGAPPRVDDERLDAGDLHGSDPVDVLLARLPLDVRRVVLPLVRVVLRPVIALGEAVVGDVEHSPGLVGEVRARAMGDERVEEDGVARRGRVGDEVDAPEVLLRQRRPLGTDQAAGVVPGRQLEASVGLGRVVDRDEGGDEQGRVDAPAGLLVLVRLEAVAARRA